MNQIDGCTGLSVTGNQTNPAPVIALEDRVGAARSLDPGSAQVVEEGSETLDPAPGANGRQWAVKMFMEKLMFGDEEETGVPPLII